MSYDVRRVVERLGLEVDERKTRGSRIWCRCPSGRHDDGDPSFMVWKSGRKSGLFHCFSCKFSGNLPELVAHVLKLGSMSDWDVFDKVDQWLASDVLATAPPTGVVIVAAPARKLGFRLPAEVCMDPVEKWPSLFRNYLLVDRGVTLEQVRRWKFGYATDGRLAMRVVMVAHDALGRPRTYSARDVTGKKPEKYLTPNEWEGADKAAIYGLHLWPEGRMVGGRIRREGRVFVAEGGFNVLALERALRTVDRSTVGGLLGSNVHPRHVLALAAFDEVIVVTDPDHSGDRAASKLQASLVRNVRTRRVVIPSGQDADSLGAELRRYLWRRRRERAS